MPIFTGTPQKIPERVAFCGFFITLFDLAVEDRFVKQKVIKGKTGCNVTLLRLLCIQIQSAQNNLL